MSNFYPKMPPTIIIDAPKVIQHGKTQLVSISTLEGGHPEDMNIIRVKLLSPDGKISDLKLTHASRGEYRTSFTLPRTGTYVVAVNVTSRDRLSSQQSFAFTVQLLPPTTQTSSPVPQASQNARPTDQIPSSLPALDHWDPQLWVNRDIHGYLVKKALEPSGTGFVLVATNTFTNREVAIKVPMLQLRGGSGSTTLGDMMSEAGKLQELSRQSDFIAQLEGTHVDMSLVEQMMKSNDSVLYLKSPPAIVMEFLKGGDAKQILSEDALTYSEKWNAIVCQIILRIAKAADTIHKAGYVHLDIKPANILFNVKPPSTGGEMLEQLKDGRLVPKLTDLGSAVRVGAPFYQFTTEYAPAQQILAWTGKGAASTDMDIYAIGATMFMMLTKVPLNSSELISAANKVFDAKADVQRDPSSKRAADELRKTVDELRRAWDKFVPDVASVDQKYQPILQKMVDKNPNGRPSAEQITNSLDALVR